MGSVDKLVAIADRCCAAVRHPSVRSVFPMSQGIPNERF